MKPGITFEASIKMDVYADHAIGAISAQMHGDYIQQMTGMNNIEIVNINNIEIPLEVLDTIAETSRQMMEMYNPSMAGYLEQF